MERALVPRLDRAYLRPDWSVLRLDRWLFASEPPQRLAALRIGLCTLLALRLALRPNLYLDLSDQPAALFRPLSFAKLLPHMPPRGVLLAVLVIGAAAAVIAAVGLRARIALPVAWVCGAFLNGMLTSQGKVIHNDVLLLLCLFCLIPARHADVWSLDAWLRRRREAAPPPAANARYGWPVRTAMVLVALGYCIIGLHKLQYSGLAWAGDNLRWVLYTASDSQDGNSLSLFVADHPLLAHIFAWSTLVLEVGFPLVLIWPVSRWLFVPGIVGLHAGIFATMKLNYVAMAGTVVIVYTNWPWIEDRMRRRLTSERAARAVPVQT
ncbi:MAG: hypothetical protein M3Z33_09865 [Actinomycetota bacterium]|nr:hypothetical protein [Actinomycetota bacterium]